MTEGWVDYLTGPWGFAFAFAAGLLSFLSPCVLPLVPAYLAHMTGTAATAAEPPGLKARATHDARVMHDARPKRIDNSALRRETVQHAIAFVLGFTLVFSFIGASVGLIAAVASDDSSYAVRDAVPTLSKIAGVFLIIMGLNLVGVIRIPWLYRTYAFEALSSPQPVAVGAGAGGGTIAMGGGSGGMRLPGLTYAKSTGVGAAFAVGWTPCIGPVLGAIFTLSATSSDVAQGFYLLLVYSLGLGVPFIITAFAVVPVTAFLRKYRWLLPWVEIVTGVLIIVVGALIFLDEATIFNSFFSDLPFLDELNEI